jgi:signal transduction histidine kinase
MLLTLLLLLMSAGIFALDISIPLGVAAGVPYIAVVFLGAWLPWRHSIILLAAIGTVLTVLGYHFSAPAGIPWMVVTNRGLALFAIWVTAFLLMQRQGVEEALKAARNELEDRVVERTAELVQANADLQGQIAERLQAEERLRQAQKMEAIGQLTGGLAHDFNNLLGVILGNAEILTDELGRENAPVQAVIRAATRGADLIQRLLAFSRRQPLQPEAIDLGALVAGMMDMLRRSLGETIDIKFVASEDLWTATADPGLLETALLNLAINARDAMSGAGILVIETGNAVLDATYAATRTDVVAGDYVMLAVTDSGTGMSPEVLERVFEPFFTTKEVGEGTGLGLSMVFGFAKQSGGHIAIYSEPGKGTTVKLYLPRTREKARRIEVAARVDVPRGRGETVLVVEDDGDVRELAVLLLQGLGYQVLEARDGKSGLAVLDEAPGVDLLLADMVLAGGMSGREMAAEAARRNGGLKVLFMSGYAENAAQLNGWVDKGSEMLQKPFRKRDLAIKVRSVLDRVVD